MLVRNQIHPYDASIRACSDDKCTTWRTASRRRARLITAARTVGGSWRVLYAVVLANLALLVVLFYLFTRAFR